MSDNQLRFESSPYLLQHADNPVDWRPWGPKALAEAQAQNKPILLSVGYAACHWCHVMAHESFEDPDIAEQMNRLFINIKVDREERPDIDTLYMSSLSLMGQPGGWPLTMFLTPKGEPFWGGTYFPAQASYGRPGFIEVLDRVAALYHSNREQVAENSTILMEHLEKLYETKSLEGSQSIIEPHLLDQIATKLFHHMDPRHGGMAGAPKFPQPHMLEFLWRGAIRARQENWFQAVERALDQMALGGLYDHLGGGFSRYTVDERWLVPHFEKMLYDNAQLIALYTEVWRETRSPLYRLRVAESMEWLEREMITAEGAYAASLDADSEGVEGKFYVWTKAQIAALLSPEDAALFCEHYDVRDEGNWEGVTILNRLHSAFPQMDETENRLAQCRAILFRDRTERVRPGLDDKILCDWNGLMIAAACKAASVFERPDWLERARHVFAWIKNTMSGPDGRLFHAARGGRITTVSLLDDHAQMIRAGLTLYETTAETRYLEQAILWAEKVEDLFKDEETGGYFTAAKDADDLLMRPKSAHDGAQPSGNATMLENFARLFAITGDLQWKKRADHLLATYSEPAIAQFFPHLSFLNACDTLFNSLEISLMQKDVQPLEGAFKATILGQSLPNAILNYKQDRNLEADQMTLCTQQKCSQPITDLQAFATLLKSARSGDPIFEGGD
ncbi:MULTISPECIES: thioredoxin domain-containing protein [unclassified Iodidimonas]|jgi:uncharacterized protein YyaL (SSP411 family)|uniref:thioredoxin domain-containing protein n=1 Tax=unclassified Iodidimonas TaxID=2626145 RepID=UPI0024822788|nr:MULTISPECIES: thioredoxin domain-containing protein [unclassified Iodidimonas]